MTSNDGARFAIQIAKLSEAFSIEFSEAKQTLYFESLSDFSIEQVESGVAKAVKTLTFPPKIAELRQVIEGDGDERAEQAWVAFLDAVAEGETASVKFLDPATAIAMEAVFGGWLPACRALAAGWFDEATKQNKGGCSDEMLTAHYKQFVKQYVIARKFPRPVETYHRGTGELSLLGDGSNGDSSDWRTRMTTVRQKVLLIGQRQAKEVRLPFDVATGQLTAPARQALNAGPEAVLAFAQEPKPRTQARALPPAHEERATLQEAKAVIAEVLGDISPNPFTKALESQVERLALTTGGVQ